MVPEGQPGAAQRRLSISVDVDVDERAWGWRGGAWRGVGSGRRRWARRMAHAAPQPRRDQLPLLYGRFPVIELLSGAASELL